MGVNECVRVDIEGRPTRARGGPGVQATAKFMANKGKGKGSAAAAALLQEEILCACGRTVARGSGYIHVQCCNRCTQGSHTPGCNKRECLRGQQLRGNIGSGIGNMGSDSRASSGSEPSFVDAAVQTGVDVRSGTDVGASGGSGVATGSAVPIGPSFRGAAKEVGVDVD